MKRLIISIDLASLLFSLSVVVQTCSIFQNECQKKSLFVMINCVINFLAKLKKWYTGEMVRVERKRRSWAGNPFSEDGKTNALIGLKL